MYLAVTGQPHTRASLVALLWPDADDAHGLLNLSQRLLCVRLALAPDGDAHIRTAGDLVPLDLTRFVLGDDETTDYTMIHFEEVVHAVDVMFDTSGRDTPAHSWGVVKPRGVVVSVVSPRPTNPHDLAGVRFDWFIVEPSREQLRQSSVLLDTGQICPIVPDVFPLAEALQANVVVMQSHARGRIVSQVGE